MARYQQGLIFEGLGVAVPIGIIAGVFALIKWRRDRRQVSETPPTLSQQSGSQSTNYQAGRDVVISKPEESGRKASENDEGDEPRER